MALANNGVRSIQKDSGEGVLKRSGSPTKSSVAVFTTFTSAGQDIRGGGNLQQQGNYVSRSFNLELQQAAVTNAGKLDATTQDFLSLCGNKPESESMRTSASATTRDFFQPLEKCGVSPSGNASTRAYATTTPPDPSSRSSKGPPELPSNAIFGEKGVDYPRERLENLAYCPVSQMKFGSPVSGLLPKTGLSDYSQHAFPANKQWQQSGTDLVEVAKRAAKLVSEDDEDEDDDYVDRGDTSQKAEGKGNDSKGSTPRSKHSATERRRRSKINDRFQMLRQLVPNHDQKRDKASFLLEVIEYIQFLQEKVRKFEAVEHGWQQERIKSIQWDVVGQRSPAESSHIDSLAYVKEPISTVSPLYPDMKQNTEPNGVIRPKLTTGVSEITTTELHSAHPASQCRLTILENKAMPTKPSTIPVTTQPSIHFAFGRSSPYVFHSFPHATETQSMAGRLSHEELLPTISNSRGVSFYNPEAANMAHLHRSKLPSVQNINNVEDQRRLEFNTKNPELNQSKITLYKTEAANVSRNLPTVQSINNADDQKQEFTVRKTESSHQQLQEASNGHPDCRESAKALATLDQRQVSGASSSRQVLNEDALASRTSSETQSETRIHAQAIDQEGLSIHGGVINISTNYSQGLLDTLTRALESSGLDLSQASISVEIKLGRQVAAMPITTQKAQSLALDALQQPGRQPGLLSGLEPPSKKPKLEVEE